MLSWFNLKAVPRKSGSYDRSTQQLLNLGKFNVSLFELHTASAYPMLSHDRIKAQIESVFSGSPRNFNQYNQ